MATSNTNGTVSPAQQPTNTTGNAPVSGATINECSPPGPGDIQFKLVSTCDKLMSNFYAITVNGKRHTGYTKSDIGLTIVVKGKEGQEALLEVSENDNNKRGAIIHTQKGQLTAPAEKKPPVIAVVKQCVNPQKRFFAEAYPRIVEGANRMGFSPDFLAALSVNESGWYAQHAQDQKNIFGSTKTDKNRNNRVFPSLEASVQFWERNHGPWFNLRNGKGRKTPATIDEFLSILRGTDTACVPHDPYNTATAEKRDENGKVTTKGYDQLIREAYDSLLCHKISCLKGGQ